MDILLAKKTLLKTYVILLRCPRIQRPSHWIVNCDWRYLMRINSPTYSTSLSWNNNTYYCYVCWLCWQMTSDFYLPFVVVVCKGASLNQPYHNRNSVIKITIFHLNSIVAKLGFDCFCLLFLPFLFYSSLFWFASYSFFHVFSLVVLLNHLICYFLTYFPITIWNIMFNITSHIKT